MNTSLTALALSLLGSTLLAACATDAPSPQGPVDDLTGETGDADKADGAGTDTFGIYTVSYLSADGKQELFVARANRTSTTCANGTVQSACAIDYLDLHQMGLTATQISAAEAKLASSAAHPAQGAQLLVRGHYTAGGADGATKTVFTASELWTARISQGTTTGTFVMVENNGMQCATLACATLTETRLNSVRAANIDMLSWPIQPDQASLPSDVTAAEAKPDGVIVVGARDHAVIEGLPTLARSVDQVYLRVTH